MNDFVAEVVVNVLQQFSPAALLAVIVVNLVIELIQRGRRTERHSPVRESGAFAAVMAVMTAWAFIALALPVGVARVENLNTASPWLLVIGLVLYVAGALPLGYVMLGFLLGAQETSLLDRHELARRRTPTYVYAGLFKIGLVGIALALLAFPALSSILPYATADRAALMRTTVVALLLADTACFGWVLVAE
jgi:hypothetical protein